MPILGYTPEAVRDAREFAYRHGYRGQVPEEAVVFAEENGWQPQDRFEP